MKEKLGGAGAAYFIRQFSTGSGDYTKDRDSFYDDLTFDEIVKGSMDMDARRQA